MNTAVTFLIAVVVLILHVWLCRRSPKFWYLGGIVPLLWVGLLVFLFFNGKIHWGEDWEMIVFPTLLFIVFWIQGHLAAKKKEIAKMKAKDLS